MPNRFVFGSASGNPLRSWVSVPRVLARWLSGPHDRAFSILYMEFEQEIIRLCEEAVACKSEAGATELARQVQCLIHGRIEQLRGNLADPPTPRQNYLGLVVGAFLIEEERKLPRDTAQLEKKHDELEVLRKRLSEAHEEWTRNRRSRLQRWFGEMTDAFRRRAPRADTVSGD